MDCISDVVATRVQLFNPITGMPALRVPTLVEVGPLDVIRMPIVLVTLEILSQHSIPNHFTCVTNFQNFSTCSVPLSLKLLVREHAWKQCLEYCAWKRFLRDWFLSSIPRFFYFGCFRFLFFFFSHSFESLKNMVNLHQLICTITVLSLIVPCSRWK